MVGGQIIIPSLYKITGNEDTTNEDTSSPQQDPITEDEYRELTTEELIQLASQGDEMADMTLQEQAADEQY